MFLLSWNYLFPLFGLLFPLSHILSWGNSVWLVLDTEAPF